jgi:hypothetical protein
MGGFIIYAKRILSCKTGKSELEHHILTGRYDHKQGTHRTNSVSTIFRLNLSKIYILMTKRKFFSEKKNTFIHQQIVVT